MTDASTILIVDDERFNVDLLEQELADLGYRTVSAGNGQEALDRVADTPPDLILLDVMMPVMDGFTACRILKSQPTTQLIPIVIMTALDGFEDRIKGIEAGADDFLTKPVNDRELKARIQTALRTKQALDQTIGEISRIKEHFEKFVPETVKRIVAANPEAPELDKRECDVSVLFLDITGYTRLCEQRPADAVNAMVERYFSTFLDHIHQAGGDVSETAGDGLMVIFQDGGGPEPHTTDHARIAVDTALDLLAATEALNAAGSDEPLGVHMGLNSGAALVGSTRFEGRSGARWVFTASGPVTNLAARLAGIAESGQIVVEPETAARLTGRYRLRPCGSQRLKNIAAPVEAQIVEGPAMSV